MTNQRPTRPDPAPASSRSRLTSAELAVWRALIDTTGDIGRRLGARLAEDTGLSPADYQVLLALSEAPGRRMRSSTLADAIDWSRSRLSHQLARLEKRGLITRQDCEGDNRGTEIVLSDAGATAFRAATAPHTRAIKELFADALSPEQFDALDDILTSLRAHLPKERP
ncbi:MarR family transcriptional regulator [Streptomyces sp. NPDC048290]|uniref:MarR family winged helix-turn-helix transcriptional regulator n=1 Tax=Streptomyces sp. NPDC048290 TaxID=3155811 RepID=UPI003447DE91